MSPRFNLLPAHYAERIAERRRAAFTAGTLVVLVALLALLTVSQGGAVVQATDERDAEQTRTGELQARRAKLMPLRQLASGIAGRERVLASSMSTQVSWAQLFASLSMTFPSDASLTTLTLESKLPPFSTPPSEPGDDDAVIGTTTLKGYSIRPITPGLDRALRLLAIVTGLTDPRLQVGAVEATDEGTVTTFEGSAFVDGAVLTGRYLHGLPPELDVEVPPMLAGRGAGETGGTG